MFAESIEKSEYARREYASAMAKLAEEGLPAYPPLETASDFRKALGKPLNMNITSPLSLSQEYIGRDDLCEFFRIRYTALPSLPFFGLIFIPHNAKKPIPLVCAAHGYLGTPELMYGLHGRNGYSDIIRRLIAEGFAVFAPQFLLWNYGFNPAKPHYATRYDRTALDKKLKEKGSSITAVEVFCILRCLDAFREVHAFDLSSFSVCGMSYGAFLTMRAMAIDCRIKAGYFMSCFDGGLDPRFPEWLLRPGVRTPQDGEIAAMCSPRPIFIEVGKYDDIFPPSGAEREAQNAFRAYKQSGHEDNFNFRIWNGGHIVNPKSDGIAFLKKSARNF